ncbi:MAG: energy transducer TonB [Verrucomicrobiae bacterium]|nr:energy transducer TonB [Verrucomicrobiae bacterium]
MLLRLLQPSYSKAFLVAAGLHATLLFAVGVVLKQPPQFGMEFGRSSIEVDLVAAGMDAPPTPLVPNPRPTTVEERLPEPVEELPEPTPEDLPQFVEERPRPSESPPPVRPAPPLHRGDGSSPTPGRDATTIRAARGAMSEAKPDYLRNPPPAYPESARRLGQEGTVLLTAEVNAEGRPLSVTLKRSAGIRCLDEAALAAVRKWRFSPARIGSLQVASRVDIPIRFQLQDSR